ncbi:MAG TPA: RICIN domain-containing protein [Planctomycetota bacterium]|nr:RICIN domain-containing protein [Planctomycetota bacterium]
MKTLSIPAVLASLLACAASAWAQSDRGRVQIQNGTVVADDGMPLRGNAYEGGGSSEFQVGRDQYHFNCFRYCCPLSADLPTFDSFVDLASQYGFYVILDFHSEQIPDQSQWTAFWQVVAPRYANRTHVLYEMANEYGPGWWPSEYGPSDIQWQQNAYQFIRSLAPQTHIITNSFANTDGTMLNLVQQQAQGSSAVDYSNASVGFHPYGFDPNAILSLKAQFPVMSTEGPWPPGSTLAWLESNGISWQIMDGPTDIISQLASGNWAVTWAQDPNTSDGTGPNNAPPPAPPPGPLPPSPAPPPPGPVYGLTNQNGGMALDVQYSGTTAGTPVWGYTPNGSSAQTWQISPTGDGYYYLTNPNSGMDLNVPGASTQAGVQLIIWTHTPGATNAEWAIRQNSDGTFTLINRNSGLVLDVQGGGTAAGTPVVQSTPTGATSQEWAIPGLTLGQANLIQDPAYQSQSVAGPLVAPWSSTGPAAGGFDHQGMNGSMCAFIYQFGVGGAWSAITQTVAVSPNTNYTLTAMIQTSSPFSGGSLGVQTPDGSTVLAQQSFGEQDNYTPVTVSFNSGSTTMLTVFAGFSGDGWIQVNNWSMVDPPGPTTAVASQGGIAGAGSSTGSSGGKGACGLTGLETVLVLGFLAIRRRRA